MSRKAKPILFYASMVERRIARDRLERGQYSMQEVARAKLAPTPLELLMQGEVT